jgi:hypothetical protein
MCAMHAAADVMHLANRRLSGAAQVALQQDGFLNAVRNVRATRGQCTIRRLCGQIGAMARCGAAAWAYALA